MSAAPDVVLLGPLGSTGSAWARTESVLAADGVTAEGCDLPGGTARTLEEAIDTFLPAGPTVLVGAGFGGSLALAAAVLRPARVRGLVLVGATAHPGNRERWQERAAAVRRDGIATHAHALTDVWCEDADRRAEAAARMAEMDSEAYASHCDLAADLDLRADLAAVDVPTTVLVAGADRALPAGHSRAIAAAVPGATLGTLPRAPHLASVDPDLDEVVRTFLRQQLRPGRAGRPASAARP